MIFIVWIIGSCQDKNEKVIKLKLPDGRYVHMPYTIKNGDTVLEGIAKYYSINKELENEYEIRDSKRNGWHYHYDSGRLFSKVMLVNDTATGQGFFYDRKGKNRKRKLLY
jgi:antitoxin component YwqK of YwqJK toxin-antitoxin module